MGLNRSLLLYPIIFLLSVSNAQECCQKKVVSAPLEYAGTYTFVRQFEFGEAKYEECIDTCIYSKGGEEYCFVAVDTGAAIFKEQYASPKGQSTTTPSSPNPTRGILIIFRSNILDYFPNPSGVLFQST